MILVTVGTHPQPFDRLVKAADEYAATTDEKVIIQTGISNIKCSHATTITTCSKIEMSKLQDEADVIVMQGGWGGMCECIDKGKRIVAVPRIEGIEHIHDQEQVVRKLESLNCIIGVYDITELPNAIKKAKSFTFKPLKRGNGADIIANAVKIQLR